MESEIEYEISTDLDFKDANAPRNYTLFMHELKRIAFGKEKTHFNHGMSADEYDRFVSDMWIGIILTLVMVLIVFALCVWYMYHKFQQWKRQYDARSRMRNNTSGGVSTDLECLPNYTLVSGLPTYDDALEQLRLSSTNHLLINHQTIMKIFGSIKDKPKKQKPDIPVPTYEDSISSQIQNSPPPVDSSATNLISSQNSLPNRNPNKTNRFKCTIVLPQTSNAAEQNFRTAGEQSSNEHPLFISNSLGSLNIIKEIKNSRPEIPWSHRSSSLCIDLHDPSNGSGHHFNHHLEHRGSLC